MTSPGRLDIAICTYRSRERVLVCLASLREAAPDASVIVIDNNSGDGTVDAVRSQFPTVRTISADANLGFARATNLAIREGDAPALLVLNPDTVLPAEAVDRLLAVLDERTDVAVVGPRLVREDGTFDHAARRSFPTIVGALGHFAGVGRRRSGGRLAQYRAPENTGGYVDAVNGAFMLIRRAALVEVGLFDEGYWMYMEDLDLSRRLADVGWKTWYEPSVTVTHVKGASAGDVRSLRLELAFHRGMLRFYRKHYRARRAALVSAAVYAGVALRFLSLAVTLPARRALRQLLRSSQNGPNRLLP